MPLRFLAFLLVLFMAPSQITCSAASADLFPSQGKVLIVRDRFGVAHVFASTETDLYYGQGMAAAQDRARQIASVSLQAQGRLAEIRGESALMADHFIRGFHLQERAAQILTQLDPAHRIALEAYCRGVNDVFLTRKGELPHWVEEYTPADALAAAMLINFYFPSEDLRGDLQRGLSGSNQFAIEPKRSATGHAMLSMDPHLPFGGAFDWLEVQLSTPEFSAIGASLPGMPCVLMGHNGSIAWCNTNNYPDLADVYLFPIDPKNPGRYQASDGWHDFGKREETFRCLVGTEIAENTETMLDTHVGPVIAVRGGVALAARIAGYDAPDFVVQTERRMRARSVQEYFEAMRIPGISMWNQLVADNGGNIGYLYNALSPRRDPGLDWSRPVPGPDPRSEWQGYLGFDELPKVINPASGWLQNCNDSPWNVTSDTGIDPASLPFRLVSQDTFTDRGRRLSELLAADDSVTPEEMRLYATDSLVLRARTWVPELLAAVKQQPAASELLTQAAAVLATWDLHADPESTGMALFYRWYTLARPGRVPEGTLSAEKKAEFCRQLETAAQQNLDAYGKLDIPWGQVLYLKLGRVEFSVTGGGSRLNVVRTAFGSMGGDGRISVTGGSSYQMIVDLGPTPRAWSCFPKGTSEDPVSPHFSDITFLYSKKEYKPLWYTWEELEPNIENQEIVTVPEIVR